MIIETLEMYNVTVIILNMDFVFLKIKKKMKHFKHLILEINKKIFY